MRHLSTMTLGEFRAETEHLPDETMIVMEYDYGDYHHTRAVNPIRRLEEDVRLVTEAYSASGWGMPQPEPEDELKLLSATELEGLSPETRADYEQWLAEEQAKEL